MQAAEKKRRPNNFLVVDSIYAWMSEPLTRLSEGPFVSTGASNVSLFEA